MFQEAPAAPLVTLDLAGRLLASDACSDALLIAADSFREIARHLAETRRRPESQIHSLRRLADVLADEAPRRAGFKLREGLDG